ncbi:dihydroflavonol-4-reductase [Pararhizobium capsulatum DSM 1112]|uniref:Dihydroflavonol-4-reductase n=1 Tax=Pararhizobium capsulatum DSM 1112 TaxID=1121113 RepID=A0ABU0BP99_9HYPH|nr:aldehyde reductase [Pararhizobium capsulatum]MDQ0320082.1 dihydroflavonol-4-reductase [Pararhizobium capsulatum DSM 1112]
MPEERRKLVVVTGAGGFLGGHIVARLLLAGYDVRGTLRSLSRAKSVEADIRKFADAGGELSFVEADLLSDRGWQEVMAGADYAIHTASPFPSSQPKHEEDLVKPALEGTLRVLGAAKAAGIKRVVVTSSIAATNYGGGNPPFTEDDWTDVDGPLTVPYYKSKTVAERAAWDFARQEDLEIAVINPGMVLGPILGRRTGTSTGVIRSLLKGKYPALPDFRVSVVDVRDAAEAHVLAIGVPEAAGQRFIVATETLSMRAIADILRQSFPGEAKKVPRFVLPNWLVRLATPFDAGLRLIVKELGRDARVSNEKARRILEWKPRTAEEAVQATAASLLDAGMV